MKPLFFLLLALCSFAPGLARAEEDTVPIDNPVATFSRPEGWPGYPDEDGVLTVSADNKVKVGMNVLKAADVKSAENSALKFFASRHMTIFARSRHEMPDRVIGGRRVRVIAFEGRDLDGPSKIVLILLKLDAPSSYLMISELGTAAALRGNARGIERILKSVKLAK